ncbi:hypothetical protein OC834_004313 [Tilletia horrida]|nr:hypothetical protein OC834_004313 [Tilletia horrida]
MRSRIIGTTLGLVAALAVVLPVQGSLSHAPVDHRHLAARLSGGVRPGQLCLWDMNDLTDNCGLTRCEHISRCWPDGTCGNHCLLLALGASGCLNDGECERGACNAGGVCALVPTGGACRLSQACASGLCDDSGTCVDAAESGLYAPGHICTGAEQCISSECSDSVEPVHVCRGGGGLCEPVSRCAKFRLGQPCRDTSQCSRGACKVTGGVCEYARVGEACGSDSECHSGRCRFGTCQALGGGEKCSYGADCVTSFCVPSNSSGVAGKCLQNGPGGFCRDRRDCLGGFCSGACLGAAGDACRMAMDCSSFSCVDFKCAKGGAGAACGAHVQCVSSICAPDDSMQQCLLYGCYTPTVCALSSPGAACYADRDCMPKSWCNGTTPEVWNPKVVGTCISGARPAPPATSASSSTKMGTSLTSAVPTSRPTGATCTTNTQCATQYCRKPLLEDRITRASAGTCDTKKTAGGKCYQNGGCTSGGCDKTNGVCL